MLAPGAAAKPTRPSVRSVIHEHAREAADLWRRRDRAAVGARHTREQLTELDARIEAHLSGLRAAHEAAWEVCAEVLPLEAAGEAFVVTALALDVGAYIKVAEVLDAAGLDRPRARGITSALGWTPLPRVRRALDAFLERDGPAPLQRMGIAGAVHHGIDPGEVLADALASNNAALRARALRAAGELGRVDLLPQTLVRDGDAEVALWSAWTGALLGEDRAVERLERIAGANGPEAAIAIDMAARAAGVARGRELFEYIAARSGGDRLSVVAASALGDSFSVGRLVEALRVPSLARLAAEGLGAIVGLDTRSGPLAGSAPEGFEAADPDPDEALPWPNTDALEQAVRARPLTPGVRYLAGEPLSEAAARRVLREGTQRRRLGAALELSLMRPGTPLAQVRQPGFRQ